MYYTVIKHSGRSRTLEKYRKHSPAARVFYISRVQVTIVFYHSVLHGLGFFICWIKHRKHVFYCFALVKSISWSKWRSLSAAVHYTVIKHSEHLRTLKKCGSACFVHSILEFSNTHRVLSWCNKQLRLLYF